MSISRRRGGHRAECTRLITEINRIRMLIPVDFIQLSAFCEELVRRRKIVSELDEEVQNALEDEEALAADMMGSSEFLITITECVKLVDQIVNAHKHQMSSGLTKSVALPTISLPTFNGSPLEWQGFWDIYNATIHQRQDIADASKFNYLISQLKGEAADLMRGFHLTDAEYLEAIELLRRTYGNKSYQVEAHLHALLDIPSPQNSAYGMSSFRSSYEGHLRGLRSLGKDVDAAGFVFAAIILRKLPISVRNSINRESKQDHWDLLSLRTAIEAEIGHLKAVESVQPYFTDQLENPPVLPVESHSTIMAVSSSQRRCHLCLSNAHTAHNCTEYTTPHDRRIQAMKLRLCFNCLRSAHQIKDCQSTTRCRHCERKHHSALCTTSVTSERNHKQTVNFGSERNHVSGGYGSASGIPRHPSVNGECTSAAAATHDIDTKHNTTVTTLLPTAIVNVGKFKSEFQIRALLDLGSQKTFIMSNVSKLLSLKPVSTTHLTIDGFCSSVRKKSYNIVDFNIFALNEIIKTEAIVVDKLPSNLCMPGRSRVVKDMLNSGYILADSTIDSDKFTDVGLLIGADQYYNFVHAAKVNNVTVIPSKLGAMLSGPIVGEKSDSSSVESISVLKVGLSEESSLSEQLAKFWEVDNVDNNLVNKNSFSEFKDCVRYEDSHFIARLPWRDSHPHLPSNYMLAYRRLKSNLNSLRKRQNVLKEYDKIIRGQLKSNFIERVDNLNTDFRCHYLPHHCVLKKSETTPVRVVFDCSARAKENLPSLNDCLFSGPPLINEMLSVLLRFRFGKYAAVSDIEKAFLMVELDEGDRDVTRFLWPENVDDPESKLLVYRFRVVLFGATCSQALLNVSIRVLLDQNSDLITKTVAESLYVDNLLYSTNSLQNLITFYEKSCIILKEGNFKLREWMSNSKTLNRSFALDKVNSVAPPDSCNVLGMKWNVDTDRLSLKIHTIDTSVPFTKRIILKQISKIFDPLGLLLPVTIRARLMMQRLWRSKIGWDEPIDEQTSALWSALANDLNKCQSIEVDRSLLLSESMDLYCYCDASTKAYGAVCYTKVNNSLKFQIAKARVAPLKNVTLPYLELMAAHTAAKLVKFVIDSFQSLARIINVYIMCDSEIVLSWISNCTSVKKCVCERINEIGALVPSAKWSHIEGRDNPSDYLTRGISAEDYLVCDSWFSGPEIVSNSDYVTCKPSLLDVETDKTTSLVAVLAVESSLTDFENIFCCFSNYSKMLRVFTHVLNFINNLRRKIKRSATTVTTVFEVENRLIKAVQTAHFPDVKKHLMDRKSSPAPNLVNQLNLKLDDEFIKCFGRLQNSSLPLGAKYPILLPNQSHFTTLLLNYYHVINLHAGVNHTLNYCRSKFWIIKGRQKIKKCLNKCVKCKRYQARPISMPSVAPLPNFRVQASTPFQVAGVDYTGHFNVKYRDTTCKVYICLFTCMSTRAIHLELVESGNTESFLYAFRRFVSKKSCPSLIMSDNAKVFQAAAVYLSALRVEWKFIPARAPHFGGVWERMIGITKLSLRKLLGRNLVTSVELQTIISEIECQVNNRPLTYVADDPENCPVTPAHLMYGRQINVVAMERSDSDNRVEAGRDSLYKRFEYVKRVIADCWINWKSDYIQSLRERDRKLLRKGCSLREGDVVLICDDGARSCWNLGKVEKLMKSSDNVLRAVQLKTKNGTITRPVIKLVNLEVVSSSDEAPGQSEALQSACRPERDAAVRAREALLRVRY